MNTQELITTYGPRESMAYDVVVVGAGPAGLATAIRLKQLRPEAAVVVLEKGSEPGAHTLSGAVMDPRAMNELFPDWKERGAPLNQPVTGDDVLTLTETGARRIPDWLVPRNFHNHGNYVVALGHVVKWLAEQAEALGVEIFPGFSAAEVLYDEQGRVKGVATGNQGIGKDGEPTAAFQLGMELHGKYTVFAEGARGHLGKQLLAKYALSEGKDPQSWAIGVKELWEVAPEKAKPGLVVHTAGWPMDRSAFGGGFLYHLEGGKRLSYGARAINNGSPQALPKTVFPGGALVGCDAGYMNAARIKGSHAAIKSGMLCAEALAGALGSGRAHDELTAYPEAFDKSWLADELQQTRNFKLWFKKGALMGQLMTGIEQWLLPKIGIKSPPWTLHRSKPDHEYLKPAADCQPIVYPKPDGRLTFDRLSSVFVSNTNHEENQPAHLTLKDASVPVTVNLATYAGPESRYCPAGVYEFVDDAGGGQRLQINAQNCVHCKTCDIKDPTQNIVWVTPEGGGGPNYAGM